MRPVDSIPRAAPQLVYIRIVRYVLAILFPSIAVLLCGRPLMAVLLFVFQLTILAWPLATLMAWLIIHDHKADRRARRYGAYARSA